MPATARASSAELVRAPGDTTSPTKLASLLPRERREGFLLELVPDGRFLTYGLGVSLQNMARPSAALAHVPVS